MRDNYKFSVGCIVRKQEQVLLVRHTYGDARGKLLIPGGFCHKNELPEEAAVREVYEETKITAKTRRVAGIRCNRKNWYILLEMDYIDGTPESNMRENSEALFCDIQEALNRNDCTEITKVVLRKILNNNGRYFIQDMEYKAHKGNDYSLYI